MVTITLLKWRQVENIKKKYAKYNIDDTYKQWLI